MNKHIRFPNFAALARQRPQAQAYVAGDEDHPNLLGNVRFYQTAYGTVIIAEIVGLPESTEVCESPVFGFHIHEGGQCTGQGRDFFANTGGHYNPYDCRHPYHAGDLPPLFGANGYAFAMFLTNRFVVEELIGKTIVVHAQSDDFRTQPAGDSGMKIACGEIVSY